MTISAETLYQLTPITDNRLSPDGKHSIYTVQRVDQKTEKKYSDLWLVATDGASEPRQFTFGNYRDVSPRWSPDGKQIAFLSNRANERQMQLHILPFHGGEAQTISDFQGSITEFEWSPDGATIACCMRERDADVLEREQDEQKKKLGVVAYHITRTFYKYDGAGFLPQNRAHLYVVDVASQTSTAMTTGDFDVSGVTWSPDGSTLAFVANLHEDPDFNQDAMQIYTIPATQRDEPYSSADFKQISDHIGVIFMPSFSADGTQIAFYGHAMEGNWWQNVDLLVASAEGGEARNLTYAHDVYVGSNTIGDIAGGTTPTAKPTFSTDGRTLYAQISRHGSQPLIAIDIASGAMETVVDDCVVGLFDWMPDASQLIYLRGDSYNPGELVVRDAVTGAEAQLTNHNANLADLPLGTLEEMWFTSNDGYKLQGWILKPADFDPNKKYPAILEIHGGPQTQYGAFFMHEFHYLVSHGYVIGFSNPRGGQGYGREHCRAIHSQWGTVDYDDLMAFADVLESQPYIDSSRIGVTGGSYGGLMTALIIGRTDRFAAACTQRAVVNWTSMWGSADFNYGWTKLIGLPHPWEDIERNWQQSPIAHVANITTPTLVIHSLADYRTNFEQSEQLYVALKVLGIDAEMVVFPEESHGLSRQGRTDRRVVRLQHILRWFEKYLKG